VKLDAANLAAIIAMALATYATRVSGFWLLRFVRVTPRMQAALDALPVAILTAVIAPALMKGGTADILAAGVTLLAASRLPLLATVILGVSSAVLLRHLIG
jgi:Predicted membrane protein